MNIFIFCNNDEKYKNVINDFCYYFAISLTNISNTVYISKTNITTVKNLIRPKSNFQHIFEIDYLKQTNFNFNLVLLDDFIDNINLNYYKKDIFLLFLNFDLFDENYFFEFIKKIISFNIFSKNIIFIPYSENKNNSTEILFEFFKSNNLTYIKPIYFNNDNWNNAFSKILKKIQNI